MLQGHIAGPHATCCQPGAPKNWHVLLSWDPSCTAVFIISPLGQNLALPFNEVQDSSHPIFLACLGCSEWQHTHLVFQPLLLVLHQLPAVRVEFMSAMKESPLDVAACNTTPCHWLAESISSNTHEARHEACCLYAALTAVRVGTARGLGTPVTWRTTRSKTQGSRRLLEDAARGVAIIFLQLTCHRVCSVTDSLD